MNRIIKKYFSSGSSYASNTLKPTYPDGLDAEVFSYKTLSKLNEITKKMEDKEHVTTLIKKLKTKLVSVESTNNHSKENLTLDESRDLKKIKKIFDYFRPNITFSYEDTLIAMKKLKLFNLQRVHEICSQINLDPGPQFLYADPWIRIRII